VELLKRLEKKDKLENIMILLTPDEEDGMHHLSKQIEYYSEADYALVFEEGSWNHLDPKPEERAIVVQRKAVGFYEVEFKGVAGHNAKLSTKDERHSAILEMAEKIVGLEKIADYEKGTLVNTGIIESENSAANMIADHAFIKVDIRYGNKEEVYRVESELKKLFSHSSRDVEIEAEQVLFYPSFDETEENNKFADIVIEQGKKLELNVRKQRRSSGSEANWIAYGNPDCAILDGFGVIGAGDHSEREFFYKESFEDAVKLSLNTVLALLK
jgi:acetylornithine deacetylase/succinyl-diaminopimelate desuccinylase-like protein